MIFLVSHSKWNTYNFQIVFKSYKYGVFKQYICNSYPDKSTSTEGIRTTKLQFKSPSALPTKLIGKCPLVTASSTTLYQHCYILPPQVKLRPGDVGHGQLNCYGSWLGYNCILILRTHPVPTSALYVTDKSTSTEEIRNPDLQHEGPSAVPTELIGKFPLATASRSTLYQHCYI